MSVFPPSFGTRSVQPNHSVSSTALLGACPSLSAPWGATEWPSGLGFLTPHRDAFHARRGLGYSLDTPAPFAQPISRGYKPAVMKRQSAPTTGTSLTPFPARCQFSTGSSPDKSPTPTPISVVVGLVGGNFFGRQQAGIKHPLPGTGPRWPRQPLRHRPLPQ